MMKCRQQSSVGNILQNSGVPWINCGYSIDVPSMITLHHISFYRELSGMISTF
jgi:hypothetical protein